MNRIDAKQLREVFDEYGAALALYARQWCNHPDDAVQEAMIELLRESPVPRDSVAWLFKAVRYRAINLARSESRRSKHQQQSAELRESWFDPEPENEFDSEELEGFLAQLPSLDREILVARIWGEMSFEQIANLVESNSSTVHRRYQSALKRLESLIHCPVKKQSEQK